MTSPGRTAWLIEAPVRAGSAYRLLDSIEPAALGPGDTSILSAVLGAPETAGFLCPRPGSLRTVKAVGAAVVRLLRSVAAADPRHGLSIREQASREVGERVVVELVADDVLEVRTATGWCSGPLAAAGPVPSDPLVGGAAAVSLAALLRTAHRGPRPASELALELYAQHRLPHSPRHARRFPDAAAVERWLGLAPGHAVHCRMKERGVFSGPRALHWLSWNAHALRSEHTPFKVYVSLHPEDMAMAMPTIADVLLRTDARLKVARSPEELLRPDKLMVYFGCAREQARVAGDLSRALRGFRPHAVPFVTPVDEDGRVGLGDDGPDVPGAENESARLRTCRRLASALADGFERGESPPRAAHQAATRLYLAGEVAASSWARAT